MRLELGCTKESVRPPGPTRPPAARPQHPHKGGAPRRGGRGLGARLGRAVLLPGPGLVSLPASRGSSRCGRAGFIRGRGGQLFSISTEGRQGEAGLSYGAGSRFPATKGFLPGRGREACPPGKCRLQLTFPRAGTQQRRQEEVVPGEAPEPRLPRSRTPWSRGPWAPGADCAPRMAAPSGALGACCLFLFPSSVVEARLFSANEPARPTH